MPASNKAGPPARQQLMQPVSPPHLLEAVAVEGRTVPALTITASLVAMAVAAVAGTAHQILALAVTAGKAIRAATGTPEAVPAAVEWAALEALAGQAAVTPRDTVALVALGLTTNHLACTALAVAGPPLALVAVAQVVMAEAAQAARALAAMALRLPHQEQAAAVAVEGQQTVAEPQRQARLGCTALLSFLTRSNRDKR